MSNNLLEVKDLRVVYKSNGEVVQAVNGISFDLKPGESIGLVGETGAGKTTTALSILRLLPERTGFIENGSIVMDGVNLLDLPVSEMREKYRGEKIAMIFQDPMTSLNPVLRVGDQIAEALIYHNNDKSPAWIFSSAWKRLWSWWVSPEPERTSIPISSPAV